MSDWKNREVDLDHLERHLENECKKRGITRRELMKGGMAMATALGIGALFAACGGDDSAAPAPAPAEGPARHRHRHRHRLRLRQHSPARSACSVLAST